MFKQIEGFILSAVCSDQNDHSIIKLYGQSNIGSFLVTIDHFQNYFFVESKNPTSFKNLDGTSVFKVQCKTQSELKIKKKERKKMV